MSLNARLKKLEAVANPEGESTILFLPEEDGPPDPEVRRRWEEYLRDGAKPGSQVIVYPQNIEVVRPAPGVTIFIHEVENWYGNDAHDRQRQREAIEGRADDVQLPTIVWDKNFYGNEELMRQRIAEREADIAAGRFDPETGRYTAPGDGPIPAAKSDQSSKEGE